MRKEISLLPVLIVIRVLGNRVPIGDRIFEVTIIRVFERAKVQKELIAVGSAVDEREAPILGWLWPGLAEDREKIKCVRQKKSPVMVKVVIPPVGDRGLRRHGLERGMSIDHAGRRIKAWIRNPPLPHPAVMV